MNKSPSVLSCMSLNKILRVFLLLILVGTFSQVQAYPGSTPAGEPDGGIIGNWAEDLRAIMAPNSITTPTSIGVGAAILSTDGDGLKTATVSADLTFDVEGKIGATHYCDKDGLQCFTAAQFAALAGGGGADGIGGDAALSVSGANLQLTDTVNTTTVPLSSIVTQSLVNGHVSTYLTSNNYVNTAAACDDAEILQYDTTNGWECVAVGSVTSDTDDQTLSLTGTTLAISEGNNVSLASFLDNTDAQDLSLVGDVLTLSGDPNAGVDLDAYLTTNNYVDESYLTTNNYITTAEVNDLAETVAITAGTCSGKVVQSNGTTWSCVTPGSGADGISATAALSINGSNLQLTDGTNTTSIALNLIDTDTDTQDLSLAGTVISLVDGGSVDLAGVVGVGTDAQDLSLSGSTLSLTGDGTTVSLASFLDNTDAQDLSLVGDVLTLSGDPNAGVDLDAYLTTNNYVDESYLTTNNYITTAEVNDLAETVAITAGTCSGKVVQSNGTTWSCVTPGSGADGISATAALSINGSNLQLTDGTNTTSVALSLIDTDTTYTAGTGLTLTGTVFSNDLGATIESAEITDGTIAFGDLATALVLDEDTLVSNSATALATQQSIKAYVDAKVDNDTTYSAGTNKGILFTGTTVGLIETCTNGDVLAWNSTGGTWDCAADGGATYTAGTGLTLTGTVFSNDLGATIESAEITDGTIAFGDLATALVLDEDTLVSNSATALATQQSIKAYVDAKADNDTTYTAGTGLTLTGTVFSNDLGAAIETGEITNGTVLLEDLDATAYETTTVDSTTNGDDLVTEAAVEAYLTANDSDTTYSAGINKGILFTGTTVGLIETCANGEVLSWSSGGSTWGCTTIPSGADNMGNGNATTAITLRDVGPDTNNWSIDEQSDEDFEFAYNGTEKIRIDTSGNLYATGYIQTSDVRFKENISTVHGLDVVSQLRGVSFDWKNSGESTLGVIAQEVESVVPELVRTDEDGYKGVNYDGFAAVLIEAIKELKLQNETLQQRVEALEASAQ